MTQANNKNTFDYAKHGLIPSAYRLPLPSQPERDAPQHLGEILNHQLIKDGSQKALVGSSGSYSYAELDAEVNKACTVFKNLGVQRYDRIAACLPNDVDIVIAFLACARLGAIWAGINRPLAGPEKAYLLKDSEAVLYLADPRYVEEIQSELKGLPELQIITVDRDNQSDSQWHKLLAEQIGEVPNNLFPEDIDPFEPAAIAYTSGTTGFPKGAVHSHHNIMLPGAIDIANDKYQACPQGVMLPLTILNLMVLAPVTAFQEGATCVCIDGLKPEVIAQWVKQENIGHFASVPTVIQDLLSSEDIDPNDLNSLKHPDIGGALCSEEVQNLYKKRFGRNMTIAYGMTEAPTIVSRTDPDKAPVNDLCGKAVEQVEIIVVDEHDNVLPCAKGSQSEVGEICVKPAESGRFAHLYTTMLGYWNNKEATEKTLSNGWYHSGDLGYFDGCSAANNNDEQGDLYMKGRTKELIIRGGANVYPAEVERIMMMHPAVKVAAVLGIDDERLGQRVVAVIEQINPSSPASEEDIYEYCRKQLGRYKVPDTIITVDELPRNAMNKVVKPKLVALF